MTQRAIVIQKQTGTSYRTTSKSLQDKAVAVCALGLPFAIIGALAGIRGPGAFVLAMGLIFIIWGYFAFKRSRQYAKLAADNNYEATRT